MRMLILPLFVIFPILMIAQVVNTEKLRLTGKEKDFQTVADFNFGLSRNKAGQTLRLGTQARLEYERKKSKWMLLGAYNLTQFLNVDDPDAVPKNFANNAFGHLRYNRKVNKWLTWEAFTQGQWDEIQEIDIRYLIGTGPRFRVKETEESHLFLGALYMLEYEETSPEELNNINKDQRLSTYLSAAWLVNEMISINHVTYFQPNLADFNDFRISSETNLSVKINDYVALKTYFQFIYDSRPPITVPESMYVLTNGLSVHF